MQLKNGHTVGIDLGTSYSGIACLDDQGEPQILVNADGEELTASVILFGDGGNVYVGREHLPENTDPARVVTGVKREIGNPTFFRAFGLKQLDAEFLSALILRKLKKDAERHIGPIANAVITVPYYFNDVCRRATRRAGQIAGLNVIDLVNEPTAATLAYAWSRGELGNRGAFSGERKVLVYDLGGGTFDVTVVRYTPTRFEVLATDGDTFLGGLDWTRRAVDYVSDVFFRRSGLDPRSDPRTMLHMMDACDGAKRRLSEVPLTNVKVSHVGREFTVELTRPTFEELTADLVLRTQDTTELVLRDAGVAAVELDDVVLVGGSTYMPSVRKMLESLCGQEPSTALNPRLAVAQGAAVHAAILEAKELGGGSHMSEAVVRRLASISRVDVNSHSLGVEVSDPFQPHLRQNHVMIPRNSQLPFEARQIFYTTIGNPRTIHIRLYEGEVSDVDACTLVGSLRVTDLPENLPVGSPVEVTYRYDAQRKIEVFARELTGNAEGKVQIVWESTESRPGDPMAALQSLADDYHIN